MFDRIGPVFLRRGWVPVPLQSAWMRARVGLPPGPIPHEMKLALADGRVLGGAEAVTWLARRVWWLAPIGWVLWLPGLRTLTVLAYRWFARRRYCFGGRCPLGRRPRHRATTFLEMP